MKKEEFIDGLSVLIEKYFGAPKEEKVVEQINKSVNEEQRLALFVVLEPQEGDTTTDAHGDTYSATEVELAARNFGEHCMKANLFHKVELEDAKIIENYTAPADFYLDDKLIKKSTWLQLWYFPETELGEALWQGVKAGQISGVSIQGSADTEKIK
jgi:hypothetical protein